MRDIIPAYHATNYRCAKAILQDGFRAGTYFAYSRDTALVQAERKAENGQLHVFEVNVPWEITVSHIENPGLLWFEFTISESLSSQAITGFRAVKLDDVVPA